MLTLAAALLHAALLGGIGAPAPAAPRVSAMQVRTLAEPTEALRPVEALVALPADEVVPAPARTAPAAPPSATPAAAARAQRPVIRIAAATPARPEPNPAPEATLPQPATDSVAAASVDLPAAPPTGDRLLAAAPPDASAATSTAAPAAPATSSAAPAAEPIPHYRTQMPGSATLRYQVSKGVLHGSGELQWRPQGDKYEITLESKIGSLKLLTQVSTGVFDADGIAPVRFTDWRVRRSTVAANFQRDAGKITFSASKGEMPLERGVQDRVSWMVQLAAIVSAQPNLRSPGAKVIMHVVGANADSSVWAFVCMGNESVRTDLGPVNALKFVRESRGAHDTTAQAWLDPTRHYLPARASLRSGADDDAFELRLEDVIGTP